MAEEEAVSDAPARFDHPRLLQTSALHHHAHVADLSMRLANVPGEKANRPTAESAFPRQEDICRLELEIHHRAIL
jgi:hypothetical protein